MTDETAPVGVSITYGWKVHTYYTELFEAARSFFYEARDKSKEAEEFKLSAAAIIFAYSSLEAFANWHIQRKEPLGSKRKRYLGSSLEQKLKVIVPTLLSKGIGNSFPQQDFDLLKRLRHGVIHQEGKTPIKFSEINKVNAERVLKCASQILGQLCEPQEREFFEI